MRTAESGTKSDNPVADLIALVYETVFDDELWPQVLLRLAGLAGADVPALGFFDPVTRQATAIAPRTDPADLLRFSNDWAGRTSLFTDLSGVAVGDVVSMQDLLPLSALKQSAVFNELLRPMGLGSAALLANVAEPGSAQAVLGLYRAAPVQDEPFEHEPRELVTLLARHIARALELRKQTSILHLREHVAFRALEHLRKGIVLLDGAGRIIFENELGAQMIDTLGPVGGDFHRLLGPGSRRSLAVGRGENVSLAREGRRSPLKLALLPLKEQRPEGAPAWLDLLSPTAIGILTDPDLDAAHRCATLQEQYELTPAEAAFALEICKGDGREAAARRRGISVSTAHTHLNRIFEKTGTTRQAELVRLLSDDGSGSL